MATGRAVQRATKLAKLLMGPDSPVSYHLGMCQHLHIVEVEDGKVTKATSVPALIRQYGVNVLLTGGWGRRRWISSPSTASRPSPAATRSRRTWTESSD